MTFKTFLIFLNFLALSAAIDFNCTYVELKWGSNFSCKAENFEITSKDNRDLSMSSGTDSEVHKVELFNVFNQIVHFFPRKLEEIFPHLNAIRIFHCELQEIKSEDLKPFGKNLKKLFLGRNEIKILESDLFVHSPKLESFGVRENQILTVEDGTFKNVPELMMLDMGNNPCFSGYFFGVQNVRNGVLEVEESCKKLEESQSQHLWHEGRNFIEDLVVLKLSC